MNQRIGVIGIGAMGRPMAACLLKNAYQVSVFDNRPEQVKNFVQEFGGTPSHSLQELAELSDVVITVLPNSQIVEAVIFGKDGIAPFLKKGTTMIEMTSGVPAVTIDLSERLSKLGVTLFDAPVSGGLPRAITGELSIMAGGVDADIEQAMPILKSMGTVIKTGAIGTGHAMKALNNLVSAGGFLIGIEALLIGSKFGIDPETMVDILNVSSGMNNSTQKKFKQYVLSQKYNSGFSLYLMAKDLGIALDMAHDDDIASPFATLCQEIWSQASMDLGPQADHTALALYSEKLAGSEVMK